MYFWAIFWLLVAGVVSVFTIANWEALTAPTVLSLVVAEVTAPLGLVLLGSLVVMTVLYLLFLVWLETKAIIQFGHARRSVADESATRTTAELRADLERQFGELRAETSALLQGVSSRLERLEQVVKDDVDASRNLASEVNRLEPHIKRVG